MEKKENQRNYFTNAELAETGLALAKQDPMWASLTEVCPLDYVMTSTSPHAVKDCRFDVIGFANYGGNEGIYGSVELRYDRTTALYQSTLKTLSTSKEAFMAMQQLVGLTAYHLSALVNENLDRFD